jgi:hypothetical protein
MATVQGQQHTTALAHQLREIVGPSTKEATIYQLLREHSNNVAAAADAYFSGAAGEGGGDLPSAVAYPVPPGSNAPQVVAAPGGLPTAMATPVPAGQPAEMSDAEAAAAYAAACDKISEAIASGAPAYNAGDHSLCYMTYRSTAEELARSCPLLDVRQQMSNANAKAEAQAPADGKPATESAWTLRRAFDQVLGDEKGTPVSAYPGSSVPVARPVGGGSSSAQPADSQNLITVKVPQGSRGGETLQVNTPSGQTCHTRVPDGLKPGDTFLMRVPPAGTACPAQRDRVVYVDRPAVGGGYYGSGGGYYGGGYYGGGYGYGRGYYGRGDPYLYGGAGLLGGLLIADALWW